MESWESRLTKSVALIYCNKFATDRRPSFLLFVASARSVSLMQIAQNAPETMITDFHFNVLRIVGQYVYIWGRIHLNQRDAIVDIQLS